jgi:hypothetical protein
MLDILYENVEIDGSIVTRMRCEDIPVDTETHCTTDDKKCRHLRKLQCMPGIFWCEAYDKRISRTYREGSYGNRLSYCKSQHMMSTPRTKIFVYDEI